MAKPLKIALLVLGGIVLLVIAALVAAVLLFDPNAYRGRIQDAVKDETGRELTLGDIQLKIFPWLRVSLADARLGNAAGFGDRPFAEVKNVSVGVQLMPLLFDKQIKVSAVELDGLHLNLAKNAEGVSNWQDLIKHQEEKPKEPSAPKSETESQFSLDSIDIDGVKIDDAAVVYDDAQAGKHYELQKLKLKTGSLRARDPFDVDLSATVLSKAPEAQADVTLSGTIKPDFQTKKLDTEGLKLGVRGKALGYDIDSTLKTRLVADLGAKIFNLNQLALEAKLGGKAIPNGSQTVRLGGDLAYNLAQGALRFQNVKLQAADLTLSSDIAGSGLNGDSPKLAGPLTIAPFSPRKLLADFGIKLNTADPQALAQASFNAQIGGTPKSVALQNVVITLDQTRLKGSFSVQDFATLAMAFALQVDSIDLDRYLPPKAKEEGKVETASGEKKDINAVELPGDTLNKLNAEGTFDIGKLKVKNLKLSDIRLKLTGRGAGAAKEQNLSAQLYGGSVTLAHRYSPGATPGYALKTQLSSFQAAPFLLDFTGKDSVSGVADFSADLSGRGKTVGDLRRTLDGKLAAQARNGAVKGFNLGALIRKAQAAMAGNLDYSESSAPETDFTTISVSGTINNGILHSEDLSAASPLFRVGGTGDINLVDETINYTAKPTIVETSKGQGGKDLTQLNGVTIPIRLTGSLWKPKYKVEIGDAVKQKAQEKIKEKLADPEVKQKINDKLNELLFGKKKKKDQSTEQPAEPQTEPSSNP
ncbi:AsmA family protein [Solimonas soli]|uniref:AsmA family protein n=1 Tax=Solimonas soli TaxID=413479 RepID=UPI0004867AAE|nr:AsmA family protein [Solimonas soli]